eukprot:2041727-Rhodomonas_salina.2
MRYLSTAQRMSGYGTIRYPSTTHPPHRQAVPYTISVQNGTERRPSNIRREHAKSNDKNHLPWANVRGPGGTSGCACGSRLLSAACTP